MLKWVPGDKLPNQTSDDQVKSPSSARLSIVYWYPKWCCTWIIQNRFTFNKYRHGLANSYINLSKFELIPYHSFDALYSCNSRKMFFVKLPVWLDVYLCSINVYAQMNYIFYRILYFRDFSSNHILHHTVYFLLSAVAIYIPTCAYFHVYICVCMCFMCVTYIIMLCMLLLWCFTYGCLVEDKQIKMFKQNLSPLVPHVCVNESG